MAQESQQESGLSTDEIISLAQARGFKVTRRQLSRLQSEGLIARPRQVHIKEVPGSHSIYPSHAGEQVCSLCTIAEHFRDQERIGWYLWRLGWPVDEKYWEPVFAEAIEFLDNFLRPFLEPADSADWTSSDASKFELSETLFDAVQKASKQVVSHPKGGPLKQRLGAEKFESLVARCLEILVGSFLRDSPTDLMDNSESDISLIKILDRAFSEDKIHTELIVKVFEYLSDTARTGTLVDEFKNIQANHLQLVSVEVARVEGLLPALMGQKDAVPKINGIPAFSPKSKIREQAILILGWSVARQMPENIENLRNFYALNGISLSDSDIIRA